MDIQSKMANNGNQRRMRRIKSFIEAMDQLGQTIEIFVNVHEFVCFIWVSCSHIYIYKNHLRRVLTDQHQGPVKFLLNVRDVHG